MTTVYRKDYTPPAFLIPRTDLSFALGETSTRVTSTLTVKRNPDAKREADLVLNGEDLTFIGASINGKALTASDYTIGDNLLTLHNVPDSFTLVTEAEFNPAANTSLSGLYRDSGGMLCTQCESEGFRRITYFIDRPDVLSVYTVRLEADKATYPVLLSNGNLLESGDLPNGRHYTRWEDPFLKPSYLFAVVAGNLQHREDSFTTMSGRKVTLRLFTDAHNMHKTEYALDALKRSMKWDEEKYGREYELDLFMIVAVDAFNFGAMENTGLNIFNASAVLANPATTTDASFLNIEAIVAHEYFHNWSGNRVTCRSWFELSLKEGFTVFRDATFSEDMNDADVCRIDSVRMLRSSQFPEDSGPMAHPIRPDSYDSIDNFYTTTVYEKGAEVIRMIRTILGAENFRKGSDLYFSRHDGQAVTCEDFVRAMEDASGIDLTQFRNWYSQAGTPVVKVSGRYNRNDNTYTLTVKQSCPDTPGQTDKLPFHIPVRMALLDKNGAALPLQLAEGNALNADTGVLHVTEAEQTFVFTNINSKPVPSLLRGFSAPVKLDFRYTRDELQFLAQHDTDGFNRWEAAQRLALDVIQEVMKGRARHLDRRLVEAYRRIALDALDGKIAPDLAAISLTLPSAAYIAELGKRIDLDRIQLSRELVLKNLASELKEYLHAIVDKFAPTGAYAPTPEQIGPRSLRNTALALLSYFNDPRSNAQRLNQLAKADNMTDKLAAIRALVESDDLKSAAEALAAMRDEWKHDPLVMDLWFSTQAGSPQSGGLKRVKKLLKDDTFNYKRPNSVRAVLRTFAASSGIWNFHKSDGSGYAFMADQIIKIDAINPQLASGLARQFDSWKRYDAQRRKLIRNELKRILATATLSDNVREVVGKALAA